MIQELKFDVVDSQFNVVFCLGGGYNFRNLDKYQDLLIYLFIDI